MKVGSRKTTGFRRVPTTVLVALLCGALAACAGDSGGAVAQAPDANALPAMDEEVLEAARDEGEVNVWVSSRDAEYESLYKDAFEAAYPDITVNLYRADGSTRDSRFMNEFGAGVAEVDLMFGSAAGPNARMKPENMLRPVDTLLIDEILEPDVWVDGDVPWMDEERKYMIQSDLNVVPLLGVAADSPVAPETWQDLLDPSLDGKLVMSDPRKSGAGFAIGLLFHYAPGLGESFVNEFYKDDRVTFSDDSRQVANWVDRGTMSVALAPQHNEFEQLMEHGSEVTLIETLEADNQQVGGYISSDGIGFVPNFEQLPHEAAATVYLNWFYSQAGQQAMVDILGLNSARADVDTSDLPDYLVPDEGALYLNLNHYTSGQQVEEMRNAVSRALE